MVPSQDTALAERRRKMRDLKRRSRELKRNTMVDLHLLLAAHEAHYQGLLSAAVSPDNASQLALPEAHYERYAAGTRKAQWLRLEAETMRHTMELFDRCVFNIDGFLIGLERQRQLEPTGMLLPPHRPPLQHSRVYMTEAACQELVRQCYVAICERKWPAGKRLSSGSQLLGWRDERYVDNASLALHFALSKRFAFGSLDAFVERTWAIVTSEKKHHARAVQRSTLGAKVLQVFDADTVLLQRRVYHAHLSTITCVNTLAFRVRTASGGCVVGFRSVRLPKSEGLGLGGVFEYDAEQRSWFHDEPALKHVWVDTFQWWVFQADDGGLAVTMGGVTKNPDPEYIGFFLVEMLACIVQWENAVAASQLSFLPSARG
ncbi:hypothetical protein PybrP1_000352 [[Pythium] brassicae (nom. inval.)]|nr:hypothetical protein PybrP1_000352 [[Pythium] brassicae (nom. inval.)]